MAVTTAEGCALLFSRSEIRDWSRRGSRATRARCERAFRSLMFAPAMAASGHCIHLPPREPEVRVAAGRAFAPGQTVKISVDMTAPTTAGPYRGYWWFKNAQGQFFGLGTQN